MTMTSTFRPYHNIVHVDDIPSAFHGKDTDGFTLVISRRPKHVEIDQEDDIEAPWARELFDYSFGPLEAFEAEFRWEDNGYDNDDDDQYSDYLDWLQEERDDYYEYNFRYAGEAENPY